eukprot:261402-Pelagomonas_calceolata.AAC.4
MMVLMKACFEILPLAMRHSPGLGGGEGKGLGGGEVSGGLEEGFKEQNARTWHGGGKSKAAVPIHSSTAKLALPISKHVPAVSLFMVPSGWLMIFASRLCRW